MKTIIAAALAAGVALTAVTPADARDGCPRGQHRGPYGHCRLNDGGRMMGAPGGLIIGNRYGNRGYWDGHRYWQHREHHQNGWVYR